MLSFSTSPYSFKIDDAAYTLPRLGFGDLDVTAELSSKLGDDPAEGVKLVRKLLEARSDKRTMDAIDALSIKDVIALIRDWIGITPGESQTSGDE